MITTLLIFYAVRKTGIPRGQPHFFETRKFKHFDKSNFKIDLNNTSWPSVANFCDVNEAWAAWKEIFLGVIHKHMPCLAVRLRNKPSRWLNSSVKQIMFRRDWWKKTQRNLANKEINRPKSVFIRSRFKRLQVTRELPGESLMIWWGSSLKVPC